MIAKGSRVRYIRTDPEYNQYSYYPPIGTLGTVKKVNDKDYLIKWDKGTDGNGEWFCEHEAVEEVFNVFNINNYKGTYVMHCKTKEEAQDFISKHLPSMWHEGSCCWNSYKSDTVYFFNKGRYQNVLYAKEKGYTILEWSDFMNGEFTKADLKTGDVVKFRCGNVGIVIGVPNIIVTKTGWHDLSDTNSDLTSIYGCEDYDIVEVRRPKEKGDHQFDAIKNKWGTLVYERKEVEEMTLTEVCRLLGKEIKIVK